MLAKLVLALALFFIITPVAQADWREERAIAIAEIVWRPTCGHFTIEYGDPVKSNAPPYSAGWAWEGNCQIGINTVVRDMDFEIFCTYVLHEGGHVVGMPHSDKGVMKINTFFTKQEVQFANRVVSVIWSGADKRCLERGRPYLEAHGILK